MKIRLEIINEAKRIRTTCQQIITDAEHWNSNVRKEYEELINPDPDGQLKRTITRIDAMLASEIRVRNPRL